ncbi:U7 snRNA-associated Sm-like protein LSm10 [Anneissia japonica]|uniref:U7 snRNA-associated Sm-like protein LSm10 n=1 Tax=Anneissia japonica TaxID=1529436 RepID=UPI00142560A5|nr:U7 snRNA-associated Sm-like protein LSm10 [Anneissia japonica]
MDMTIRERTKSKNSLTCLIQALEGKVTTIELRNESEVYGEIESVDGYMNVQMKHVEFTDQDGNCSFLENLHVRGRNIRYVHIPDDVNILGSIRKQLGAIERSFGGRRNRGGPGGRKPRQGQVGNDR